MPDPELGNPSEPNDNATGLPVLTSWPAVYGFVLVAFSVWVVLLTVLSRAFL